MPIYQGTAIKNVFDLINRDNPGLPFPVTEATFIAGTPVAITPTAQKHDTRIRLVAKTGSMYRGALTITYRRIILNSLFRDTKPIIERFLVPTAPAWVQLSTFIPLINAATGMNFSMVDFIEGNTVHPSQQPGRDFTITAKAESLMYTGTLTLAWKQGKEELGLDIMTVNQLPGVQWPAGNDFVANDDRRSYGTWLFWNRHFTEEAVAGAWATALSTTVSSASTSYPQIKLYTDAFIDQDLEINFNPFDATTNPKGIGAKNLFIRTITLPDAAYPEVSRSGFTNATILYPADAALYAKYGRAILYFNK